MRANQVINIGDCDSKIKRGGKKKFVGKRIDVYKRTVCACGKKGCLQTFIGENAIRDLAKTQIRLGQAEGLRNLCENPEEPEIEEIVTAVDLGEEALKEALLPAVRYMGTVSYTHLDVYKRQLMRQETLQAVMIMILPSYCTRPGP